MIGMVVTIGSLQLRPGFLDVSHVKLHKLKPILAEVPPFSFMSRYAVGDIKEHEVSHKQINVACFL